MARMRPLVDGLIKSTPVVVFSKSYCPYCVRAKRTLADQFNPDQIRTIELDQDDDGSAIQSYLASRAGTSSVTVPQIFISGHPIGGNDDLQSLLANRSEWQKVKAGVSSFKAESVSSAAN